MPEADQSTPDAAQGEARPPARDVDVLIVELAELHTTYPVKELLGRKVMNDSRETIGTIDDLMIEDDRLAFVVLSVGGFLGMGAHKVLASFDSLIIDDEAILLPGASEATVRRMTVYDAGCARSERTPLSKARKGVRDAGQIVETAGGEPIPGAVADITDGDL